VVEKKKMNTKKEASGLIMGLPFLGNVYIFYHQ